MTFTNILASGEFDKIWWMISQCCFSHYIIWGYSRCLKQLTNDAMSLYWFGHWQDTIRHEAITWTNVDHLKQIWRHQGPTRSLLVYSAIKLICCTGYLYYLYFRAINQYPQLLHIWWLWTNDWRYPLINLQFNWTATHCQTTLWSLASLIYRGLSKMAEISQTLF